MLTLLRVERQGVYADLVTGSETRGTCLSCDRFRDKRYVSILLRVERQEVHADLVTG